MSRTTILLSLATGASLVAPASVRAQEVEPRWTLEGRGLLSSPVTLAGDDDLDADWVLVDFADTHLSTRFDKALYDDTIGAFALGVRLTDRDSPVGPLYLYQVEGGLQAEHVVLRLGRTRRPVLGVMFPTLRDEDLLELIYPLDPFSAGALEEDALFSELASITLRRDFVWHAQIFLESLRNTAITGDPARAGDFGPNGAGLRLFYDQLPALSRITRVKHLGLGVFAQRTGDEVPELDTLVQLRADASVNLRPDPVHLVDLRLTALYQHGGDDLTWTETADVWRGRYVSGAAAVRYLYGSYGVDRLQAGLSGGLRRYTDRSAWHLQVTPTLVYMLGAGVDVAAQYSFVRRDQELVTATGAPEREHVLEVALGYAFELRINDTINTPRDILNADYSYIPVN